VKPTISPTRSPGPIWIEGALIKIILIHNPLAGKGQQPPRRELLKLIRAAGHKAEYQSSKEKKWHKILQEPADIVAVAGGDGTVGKVARRLIGTPTPIAILPLGTANNIACSVGIANENLKNIIAGWKNACGAHFDAGVAKGPWGSQHFIEGFGLGLFAETMFQLDSSKEKSLKRAEHPDEEINAVLEILRKRLRDFKSADLRVRLDGKDLSGQYVLLEALNVRSIGPNLNLAPSATTNDGLLDIVAVPHAKRAELNKYLGNRVNGAEPALRLRRHRGKFLQIEWENSPVHIDDTRWPDDHKEVKIKSHSITITVEPGALVFLIPSEKRRRARRRA
jgi:diacylglycerol kinase family enzyme